MSRKFPKRSARSVKPPIKYYGGKSAMLKRMLALLPGTDVYNVYVEVFGGAGWLLFAKPPSRLEVYNDIDHGVVDLYRVLRDDGKLEEFRRRVELIPYSREEHKRFTKVWRVLPRGSVEKAVAYFVACRQAFNGELGCGWKTHIKDGGAVSSWLGAIELLPAAHRRLREVQIENMDFRKLIPKYDRRRTLFYLDPPYVHSTRGTTDNYIAEMSEADHEELIELLLGMQGMALVSGYAHKIYERLEKVGGFVRVDISVATNASGKEGLADRSRVESLWMNPAFVRVSPIKFEI